MMPAFSRLPTVRWIWMLLLLLAVLLLATTSPALAHKEHKKKQIDAAEVVQPPQPGQAPAVGSEPTATPAQMGETMKDGDENRSTMTSTERLLDWLGRLHPIIVHFPIAFFPAALFTAVVGRRRPAFAAPVQFLVVTGGIIAPIAALLGWFDAIGADPDPLLTVHRWLGTAIGIGGLGLALFAWRRPDENRGSGMIITLAVITTAVMVQGWYGGALVHGVDHLNW